jgi:chromatin structure-remodeling complex subunit RSC1/2
VRLFAVSFLRLARAPPYSNAIARQRDAVPRAATQASTALPETPAANMAAASPETPIPTTENAQPAAQASTVTDPEWKAMQAVLNSIYETKDPKDGRDVTKLFQRKVNKRSLPDYYEVIKEPMALSTIKAKIAAKEYKTFADFVRDFALIPHNAFVYNRPESGAYIDALVIKGSIEKELQKLADEKIITENAAQLPYLGEIPIADELPPVEERAEEEESEEDEDEDEDDEADDSEEEGGRRKKRGRPRSTAAIAKREGSGKYDKGKEEDDPEARKKRGRPPRVDTPMEARIKSIMKGMRRAKNPQSQLKVLHFERLPDRAAMPEYFAEIKQPIALDMIKKKLKRKKYTSVDQFMRDIELMFENAKLYNTDDSQIYQDAVDLQVCMGLFGFPASADRHVERNPDTGRRGEEKARH